MPEKAKNNQKEIGSTDKKGKEDSKKDPPSTKREPLVENQRTGSTSYKGPRSDSQTNFYNVCVQLKLREEIDSEDTDSEEESYNTPPESNQEDKNTDTPAVEDVDPIDANTAELTDDDLKKDSLFDNESEIEEIMNNPSNDTTVELGNLLNLPDILDIQGKQTDTLSSNDQNPGSTQRTPTKRSRSNSPPKHQQWASHPPLKDTILQPIRKTHQVLLP